ncbi:protein TonB [Hymenobacter daecheongensis DSM 21074]|uniref:Protein TonB n=1 Tax=Hymenobacter daecheongensis DSM 21074 TaxID=1121955 RepID=A0A1M6ANB7_9BACT|nr:energy transducer TonB [Hymenobacter daecheongensis]SHI37990.1 protein TonB [Hymenobacter daecheongensis DSM 21074]
MNKLLPLSLLATLLPLCSLAQRTRTTEYESGMVEKGAKIGVWEYYAHTRDGRQVTIQKYDHTARKLLFYRPIEDIPYEVEVQPGQWTRSRVDQPPLFIGGDPALAAFTTKLVYPKAAQDRNLQGRVVVALTIDTLGQASGHKVLTSVGGGCDEEALRVARKIPNQWIPARKGGRAVPIVYELPFTFKLQAPALVSQ